MPPTTTRSSLKKKGPNLKRKMNVSFTPDLIYRTPGAIASAMHRSFESVAASYQGNTPNTIRTLRLSGNDDPNDKNYTSTDEEADEFKNEPYEHESSPELSEDDNYSVRSTENPEDEYYNSSEDSYLLEIEEKLGHKISAFSPLHQIRRTPVPKEKMENLQHKRDPKKYIPPPKRNPKKSRLKVNKDGSPHLNQTPNTQLDGGMEGKTPDQPG